MHVKFEHLRILQFNHQQTPETGQCKVDFGIAKQFWNALDKMLLKFT